MGNPGTGKSCLIKRYCEDKYVPDYVTTIGIDYGVKSYKSINGDDVKVNFWDVAGDPIFFDIRNEFYRDTHGAFLVFDVSDKDSFDDMIRWVEELKQYTKSLPFLVVVGNKIDLERSVSKQEAFTWAAANGAKYFETSSMDGTGVTEFFITLFEESLKILESQKRSNEDLVLNVKDVDNIADDASKL